MDLVKIENGNVVVSSRNVAEHFGKRHDHVLRDIEGMIGQTPILGADYFYETTYKAGTGKSYKEYLMNRDGFSLLVMGFTGKEAMEWKLKYIEAFNQMEQELRNKELKQPNPPTERDKAMLKNAQARSAKLWLEIAKNTGIQTYKDVCNAYAAKELAGEDVLPLPKVQEKTYSATDIGKMLGVSKNKIGSLASKNDMKCDEYGAWFHDKSPYSGKEVETFRYNDKAVEKFRALLKGGAQA